MFSFHYQAGSARRKRFESQGAVVAIGSARSNDLILDTRKLGKRHAELRLQADGVHVYDMGSAAGCWVNRERILNYGPLTDLDEVAVGDVHIVVDGRPVAPANNALPQAIDLREGEPRDKAPKPRPFLQALGIGSNKPGRSPAQPASATPLVEDARSDAALSTPAEAPLQRKSVMGDEPHRVDDRLAYWGGIVHEQLIEQMDLRRKDVNRMSDAQLRQESLELIAAIVSSLGDQLPEDLDRNTLRDNVLNESVGLGPLEQFLADESVTEIMVNNHAEIFIERCGRIERSRFQFSSDRAVFSVIERIITPLGRRIDESSPIVDARLKDGSRVNAVIPPLALKGPSVTIRKFPKHRLHFADLIQAGSIDESMVEFLRICVQMRKNIIVSGGTGSGKTTLLNVLSNFIPDEERIVTIEDAAELKLVQPNLVSLESRPANLEGKGSVPIRDLVKNSLRMRPDRIVVGECRGGEALDMLQAMNTGHDGSLTTLHANSPRDALGRLEVLVLMAGMDLPVTAIREQAASAVDLIIQQTRFSCGSRKVTRISEVVGVESGVVQLQDIFVYRQDGLDAERRVRGRFVATGAVPTFYESLREMGIELDMSAFEQAVPL